MNIYHIALTMIPRLGNKGLRTLARLLPQAEDVYSLSHSQLQDIFGKHTAIIDAIEHRTTLADAEQAARRLEEKHIRALFFTDPDYPQRMNRPGCDDCPALIYLLGNCDLNPHHAIAVVGTRKATAYGTTTTHRLVNEMAADRPLIVSGLAYGIDTAAHSAAVAAHIPTVGVLAHGLDRIYPQQNRELARQMLANGGALLTEYPLDSPISTSNFPARNRIIAAISDATVVVESTARGGALITANMAIGYHREVFAVPGYLDAPYSAGCNNLITNNKAILLRNAGDIYYQMGWDGPPAGHPDNGKQQQLFEQMSDDEKHIADLLADNREMSLDEIAAQSGFPMQKTASTVFAMEMKNIIRCLPGRLYKLI